MLYNPLARVRTEWIRLPVPSNRALTVSDAAGMPASVSFTPVAGDASIRTAVFAATVPPLGHATMFLVFAAADNKIAAPQGDVPTNAAESIENGVYRITFDTDSGLAQSITDLRSGKITKVCLFSTICQKINYLKLIKCR